MPASPPDAAREAVRKHCPKGVDAEVIDYLADSAAGIFEEGACEADEIASELENALGPFLEDAGVAPEVTSSFCQAILKAVQGGAAEGGSAPSSAGKDFQPPARSKDCLCYVTKLLLMYGGSPQPLLKNATLELTKGQRYGIVGANGTGKTTLMARMASRDILGFPQDVRVVHLRHEAILRGVKQKTTARQYAEQRNTAAGSSQPPMPVCPKP